MASRRTTHIIASLLASLTFAPAAHAQWAVVDVGAIAQLIEQVAVLREQLSTARDQLDQARQEYAAITGTRSMQDLLRNVDRNYLPMNWTELGASLQGAQHAYGALTAEMQRAYAGNAVLSEMQLGALSAAQRADLEGTRRTTALMQALARQALATTSERFGSLEQLIDAISRASDQKAILDLQARIGAEANMLANEQTKLEVLQRAAEAESVAQQQRPLERAIADIGSLRELPPLGL